MIILIQEGVAYEIVADGHVRKGALVRNADGSISVSKSHRSYSAPILRVLDSSEMSASAITKQEVEAFVSYDGEEKRKNYDGTEEVVKTFGGGVRLVDVVVASEVADFIEQRIVATNDLEKRSEATAELLAYLRGQE